MKYYWSVSPDVEAATAVTGRLNVSKENKQQPIIDQDLRTSIWDMRRVSCSDDTPVYRVKRWLPPCRQ